MTLPDELPHIEGEILNVDLIDTIRISEPPSLAFSLSTYQKFDATSPTAVLAYITGQLGLVVWNLDAGQTNDYHYHPTTEHLHVIIEGECEYSLGEEPPITVGVGQAVMVPAGIPHGIRNTTDKRASYLAIASPGPYEKIPLKPGDEIPTNDQKDVS